MENGNYEKVLWKMASYWKVRKWQLPEGLGKNGSYQRVWGKMAVTRGFGEKWQFRKENAKAVSLETTPRPCSDWCVVKVLQTCLLVRFGPILYA